MDIIERLRSGDAWYVNESLQESHERKNKERIEAADEIERLREALNQAQCGCELPCLQGEFCSSWICRSALQQKESE